MFAPFTFCAASVARIKPWITIAAMLWMAGCSEETPREETPGVYTTYNDAPDVDFPAGTEVAMEAPTILTDAEYALMQEGVANADLFSAIIMNDHMAWLHDDATRSYTPENERDEAHALRVMAENGYCMPAKELAQDSSLSRHLTAGQLSLSINVAAKCGDSRGVIEITSGRRVEFPEVPASEYPRRLADLSPQ